MQARAVRRNVVGKNVRFARVSRPEVGGSPVRANLTLTLNVLLGKGSARVSESAYMAARSPLEKDSIVPALAHDPQPDPEDLTHLLSDETSTEALIDGESRKVFVVVFFTRVSSMHSVPASCQLTHLMIHA